MGYFGFRAAPLGAVGPDVVTDAFYNFRARRWSRKAIPDVWSFVTAGVAGAGAVAAGDGRVARGAPGRRRG